MGVQLDLQQYLSYIFGNKLGKPQTCRQSLTNLHNVVFSTHHHGAN